MANRNNAPTIADAIRSVTMQTLGSWELLVIDGMSIDGSAETAGEFAASDPRIKVVNHYPSGVYEALNYGLSLAGGSVITCLHANDRFIDDHLFERVESLIENHDYVYGNVRYVNNFYEQPKRFYRSDNFDANDLLRGFAPPHPGLFLSREAAVVVGDYDTSLRNAADFELFVKLFMKSDLRGAHIGTADPTVEMTLGGASTTLACRLWRNPREKLKALRKNNLHPDYLQFAYRLFSNLISNILLHS